MGITDNLKEKKYVAFLDVLGFKELVNQKGPRLDTYFNTITKALKDINEDKSKLTSQLVSDSTILACDLNRGDLRTLLTAVQTIQARCALENIWMRGAISIGDIYFDRTLNIVVGNGLSDAYVLETQEKFPRIIIDPKILQHDFGTRVEFIQEYNTVSVGTPFPLEIPLLHDYSAGRNYIDNDAFFVTFAERIAVDNCDDLEIIYNNIKSELYKGQKNYPKYFWLKNYFIEALGHLEGNTEGSPQPVKVNREKLIEYTWKFRNL